jgi:hypothetical protein|tara:strand:+ start:715 stop:1458 length:744 start_codon:yes stop_codon:yes gene_type:complete
MTDNIPPPPETRVYRMSHPTKIIETDTLSRSPEAPLFHSLVELLKLMLLLLISLLLGLIYNKDIHTTITYQTSEANNQSLVCPSCPVLPPPPPPTEQLVSSPPPPTTSNTTDVTSPPPPDQPPALTTDTGKEYKIQQVSSSSGNPEGKLQELTADGWELINGGYAYGLHTFYLSRENATSYEYMYEVSRIYEPSDGTGQEARRVLMRDDMTIRLNELAEEGWIFILFEEIYDSIYAMKLRMFLKRPK